MLQGTNNYCINFYLVYNIHDNKLSLTNTSTWILFTMKFINQRNEIDNKMVNELRFRLN